MPSRNGEARGSRVHRLGTDEQYAQRLEARAFPEPVHNDSDKLTVISDALSRIKNPKLLPKLLSLSPSGRALRESMNFSEKDLRALAAALVHGHASDELRKIFSDIVGIQWSRAVTNAQRVFSNDYDA